MVLIAYKLIDLVSSEVDPVNSQVDTASSQIYLANSQVDTGQPQDGSASLQVAYSGNSQDTN